jgi:hypothetical protein
LERFKKGRYIAHLLLRHVLTDRRRERAMSGFRDSKRTQAFLSPFGPDPAALRIAQTSHDRAKSSRHTTSHALVRHTHTALKQQLLDIDRLRLKRKYQRTAQLTIASG